MPVLLQSFSRWWKLIAHTEHFCWQNSSFATVRDFFGSQEAKKQWEWDEKHLCDSPGYRLRAHCRLQPPVTGRTFRSLRNVSSGRYQWVPKTSWHLPPFWGDRMALPAVTEIREARVHERAHTHSPWRRTWLLLICERKFFQDSSRSYLATWGTHGCAGWPESSPRHPRRHSDFPLHTHVLDAL
jgi:hypothetical protein